MKGTHPFKDDDDAERLVSLAGNPDLKAETQALYSLQKEMALAMVAGMRAHTDQFPRIKGAV